MGEMSIDGQSKAACGVGVWPVILSAMSLSKLTCWQHMPSFGHHMRRSVATSLSVPLAMVIHSVHSHRRMARAFNYWLGQVDANLTWRLKDASSPFQFIAKSGCLIITHISTVCNCVLIIMPFCSDTGWEIIIWCRTAFVGRICVSSFSAIWAQPRRSSTDHYLGWANKMHLHGFACSINSHSEFSEKNQQKLILRTTTVLKNVVNRCVQVKNSKNVEKSSGKQSYRVSAKSTLHDGAVFIGPPVQCDDCDDNVSRVDSRQQTTSNAKSSTSALTTAVKVVCWLYSLASHCSFLWWVISDSSRRIILIVIDSPIYRRPYTHWDDVASLYNEQITDQHVYALVMEDTITLIKTRF